MNFAQTIKAYRTRSRLTLSQFSELSGVERATINRLERGLGNPRPMTVYLLTQAMKLTPSEIDKKLNPSDPAIVENSETSKPDNSMHTYSSEHLAYEFRKLNRLIDRIENLIVVVLTAEIMTLAYIVFFVAK